jgi:hypothetical protein
MPIDPLDKFCRNIDGIISTHLLAANKTPQIAPKESVFRRCQAAGGAGIRRTEIFRPSARLSALTASHPTVLKLLNLPFGVNGDYTLSAMQISTTEILKLYDSAKSELQTAQSAHKSAAIARDQEPLPLPSSRILMTEVQQLLDNKVHFPLQSGKFAQKIPQSSILRALILM